MVPCWCVKWLQSCHHKAIPFHTRTPMHPHLTVLASEFSIRLSGEPQNPVSQRYEGLFLLGSLQQLVVPSRKLLQLCVCAGGICQQPLDSSVAGDLVGGAVDRLDRQPEHLLLTLNIPAALQNLIGCACSDIPNKV